MTNAAAAKHAKGMKFQKNSISVLPSPRTHMSAMKAAKAATIIAAAMLITAANTLFFLRTLPHFATAVRIAGTAVTFAISLLLP